jgi:hypothetical protein
MASVIIRSAESGDFTMMELISQDDTASVPKELKLSIEHFSP